MFEECLRKQSEVKALFDNCETEEDRYKKIIELGRQQPALPKEYKKPENIIHGCQSTVYIHASLKEGKVIFATESDAIISSGLAALLVRVYSGETPEVILKCPPVYLEEIGVSKSLTPNRSNGLYSIHLRMKQEALKLLIESEKGRG